MRKSSVLQMKQVMKDSLTLQYIQGKRSRYVREKHDWTYSVTVEGAMEHNLKNIDVKFPLGVLTVVTGVSGSGKSSLVGDILYPAMRRRINETGDLPGIFKKLSGNLDRITRIEYVDQNPIGKSSRSNAVTYLKVYDDIRKLLADQQYARINGYTPSFFSFNQDGGRCPECQGEGFVKIPMQFMADVTMVCEACGGKRFKPDILEVRYQGRNIDDILNMSVEEAIGFFGSQKDELAKQIASRLQPLVDVGLSYIKLGQSSSTLSGGESQRIKLAYFLSQSEESDSSRKERIMFLFDEPTTGLHFFDVEKLLKAFDVLIAKGHTVIVVEHNLDVIRAADWVIDMGPDAGDRGGEVVFAGTPEDLVGLAAKRQKYLTSAGEEKMNDVGGPARYVQSNEIFYAVASIIRFAPFIGRIFIVTDGQDPHLDSFIAANFPGSKVEIRIVSHADIIFKGYEEFLPVFNSRAIETMLWRIPGLSEDYIFMNDDFFFAAPSSVEDFFRNGKVVCYSKYLPVCWEEIVHYSHPVKNGHRRVSYKDSLMNAALMLGFHAEGFAQKRVQGILRSSSGGCL